ncbi:YbaB/EbfC family nucleoid-associated protein [Rhodococcus sp. NPDC058639]|uniref:YbaB/EbfC family nucleoid-associated protein n=1 Tax=Rhodococcus sp. NPDC058639 TaxID=3346570 RepID=UPI0036633024
MSEQQVTVIVDRVRTKLDALESTLEGLHGIRATAQSPDGRITARVDGTGALADLRLEEAACRMDARELAASILTTVHAAAEAAAAQRVALVDDLRGALR